MMINRSDGEKTGRCIRQTALPRAPLADSAFRDMLDQLPAAVCAADALGRITYFNPAAAELWGVRPEIGETRWCGSWKLYTAGGRPMRHDECAMAVCIRERRAATGEAIAERPDGTRVPFRASSRPLFDEAGAFTGALNLLTRMSERVAADVQAPMLKAIVEFSDDAIISKDLDGVIRSWNAAAERLFGYRADEAIGRPITMLIPPGHENEEPEIIARIRRGERTEHYETVRRRKDGSLVDVEVSISPVKDSRGRIVGASKIARDISARKRQAERQKLLMSEMRHRIKNTLSTVQAMAAQTLRNSPAADREAFSSRLMSLARAHDLLTAENWNSADLADVVQQALLPFRENFRARIAMEGGAGMSLDANKAMLLTLTLHELATNAVKYGALSNEKGRVELGWHLAPGAPPRLLLHWSESGGPQVLPPEKKGFGSMLIERVLSDLGRAQFDFAPAGVTCTLDIAL